MYVRKSYCVVGLPQNKETVMKNTFKWCIVEVIQRSSEVKVKIIRCLLENLIVYLQLKVTQSTLEQCIAKVIQRSSEVKVKVIAYFK